MVRLLIVAMFLARTAHAGEWKQLPPIPDKEGFAGAFAGVSNGVLLVAGGANFPNKKPRDGGQKVWYDTVFALDRPDGRWTIAGKLPRPLGYGVSVSYRGGVICVGGSDAERHHADVFRLEWKSGKLVTARLPSLPKPVANACGALVGDTLYLAGGLEAPNSEKTLNTGWKIDLADAVPVWSEIEPCPGGGRMLAVAATFDGAFWMAGGVDLVRRKDGKIERQYRTDAYRYESMRGWKRIADLPQSMAAAPSPAPADESGFYILGGDDGSQVGTTPDRHQGFRKSVLRYNARADKWVGAGDLAAARVTVSCIEWNGLWVLPSGEARPGVRSPEVWARPRSVKE